MALTEDTMTESLNLTASFPDLYVVQSISPYVVQYPFRFGFAQLSECYICSLDIRTTYRIYVCTLPLANYFNLSRLIFDDGMLESEGSCKPATVALTQPRWHPN